MLEQQMLSTDLTIEGNHLSNLRLSPIIIDSGAQSSTLEATSKGDTRITVEFMKTRGRTPEEETDSIRKKLTETFLANGFRVISV